MKQNELFKTKVVLYPGTDEEQNIPAIPLANSIIVGATGSGKTVLVNNLIKNLIQNYSGESIEVSIWDGLCNDLDVWIPKSNGEYSTDRYIQHIKTFCYNIKNVDKMVDNINISYRSIDDFIYQINKEVISRKECLQYMYDCDNYEEFCEKHTPLLMRPHIIFINEYTYDLSSDNDLYDLLSRCEETGVYIILSTQQSTRVTEDILELCDNKFELKLYSFEAERLFNSSENNDKLPRSGYCIYHNYNDSTILKIPFTPDSFLRKFVGYHSIRCK